MSVLRAIKNQKQQGFTLLEVLLVVAIIAILAGIVIIAINPNKNLGDTRNSQRSSDVSTILNAVYQYSLDNNGALPAGIDTTAKEICASTAATCPTSLVDLNTPLTPKYIVKVPSDPQCPSACATDGAGYMISATAGANARVTVNAPDAEQSKSITVTK